MPPGMFSKYGNNKVAQQRQSDEDFNTEYSGIGSKTGAPDLSGSPSSGGRYDLSSGSASAQIVYDYKHNKDVGGGWMSGRGGGMGGKYGKPKASSYKEQAFEWAEGVNKGDAQRFAETKGRRSAMNYILKLPSIRGIGASNRGMATSASRLGM